jgi:hypothetical protein
MVLGFCEHGSEPSVKKKDAEVFLSRVSDYWLFKNIASWG